MRSCATSAGVLDAGTSRERLFASAPQVHATVEARITHGDFVVWRETATGMPRGRTNTAIFVWEVHDGKITQVLAIP